MGKIKSFFASYREAIAVLCGDVIVSALIVAVYLLIGEYDYTVITGAALGSLVTVVNLFILSISINRAIDKYMKLRGNSEMDEETAAAFAAENAKSVQLAASGTYLIRTLLMAAALVSAFVFSNHFDVIATVIPLITYRPILYVFELIRNKIANKRLQKCAEIIENGEAEAQIPIEESSECAPEAEPECEKEVE